MARQPNAPEPSDPSRAVGKKTSYGPLWFAIIFVGVAIASLASVILLLIGMLPTLVAWIIDRTPQKYATYCVGGVNLCGVFPFVLDLWAGENDIAGAMEILTDVFSLLLMYGAAGFGWMIFIAVPPVVGAFLTVMAQHRVNQLRRSQKDLIEEWGEDVAVHEDEMTLPTDSKSLTRSTN